MDEYYHRPASEGYVHRPERAGFGISPGGAYPIPPTGEFDWPPSEPTLPPLPIWQARSFWLALTTAAALVANVFGVDFDENLLAERILNVVPLVTFALAYRERLNPSRRLTGRK